MKNGKSLINKCILVIFLLVKVYGFENICKFSITNQNDLNKIYSSNLDKCKDIFISFGVGKFVLDKRIEINTTSTQNILINGYGVGLTKIILNNKKGFINIFHKNRNSIIKIEDLTILIHKKNIKNVILISQITGGNQHIRNVILKNLNINNYQNKEIFFVKNAINLKNIWRPLLENVIVSGFYGPKLKILIKKNLNYKYKMDVCFLLDNCYSASIINSRCWSSNIGVLLQSKYNPGPEGFYVEGSKFVDNLVGIKINLISQEPEGFIVNNHINSRLYNIEVFNKKFLIINNNLLYQNEFSLKNFAYLYLVNVKNSILKNNIFHMPSKKIKKSYDIILKHCKRVIINSNIDSFYYKIKIKDFK